MCGASNIVNTQNAELLAKARNGDLEAFAAVFEELRPMVHAVATRLIGPDEADDVVMETYLKAWQGLGTFRGGSGLSTWIYRITRNCALDMIRRRGVRQRRAVSADEAGPGGLDSVPDSRQQGPDAQLAARELRGSIEWALGQVPDHHRVALELRHMEGLSYSEIAAATGVSIGTVMSRLFNGRRRLQRLLACEVQP